MGSLVSFFYHIDIFQITSVIDFAFVKIFIERHLCTKLASGHILKIIIVMCTHCNNNGRIQICLDQ
jgi:hypothetical protein